MFSRAALETYLTHLQDVVKGEISKWCAEAGPMEVYTAARSLTFRIAVHVLLGLRLDEQRITHLSKTFEQLMNNLFSLPVDAPLSGLRKVRNHISINHIRSHPILISHVFVLETSCRNVYRPNCAIRLFTPLCSVQLQMNLITFFKAKRIKFSSLFYYLIITVL